MTISLRIAMAQLNLTVGDIAGNLEKHLHYASLARDQLAAQLIVFPELSLIGYPPEDLLLRPAFQQEAQAALQHFMREMQGIYCLVGHTQVTEKGLFNACSLIYNGKLIGQYAKQRLPNYGVFDECRYFTPGQESCVLPIHGLPCGIVICEDIWKLGPTQEAAAKGARLLLVPNASPFEKDKHEKRLAVLSKRAQKDKLPIIYVNQIGGQDELIFDGGSMVIDAHGQLCQLAGFFNETLLPVDVKRDDSHTLTVAASAFTVPSETARIYQALVLGVKDYIEKNHAPGVLVGVSGGIDSALTLAIAVDALGKDRVHALVMPSRYTADISLEDASALTQALEVRTDTISIEPMYQSFLATLAPLFMHQTKSITDQNLQARVRAVILMAFSNQYGKLVLTTGNRSEIAVGYCTLYGDMAGAYAVLKDIPKTLVYALAQYRNQSQPVIPQRIIDRPPTAELAPNQKDEDTLPPYPVLDAILEKYLNQKLSLEEIVSQGLEENTVQRVINLIHQNEYKRKQSAIGPHIDHSSFGKDWRYPLTNGFKN